MFYNYSKIWKKKYKMWWNGIDDFWNFFIGLYDSVINGRDFLCLALKWLYVWIIIWDIWIKIVKFLLICIYGYNERRYWLKWLFDFENIGCSVSVC